MQNLIGLAGIVVILAIAFAFSSNRKAINLRVVGAAFGLQVVIAVLVLYWDRGQRAIEVMKDGVMAVIGFSQAGINMVFGPLGDTDVIGFSFAINVLPIIIFFSALMSVLYHLRIMEWIVKIVGGALHKIIGTGAVESMNAAANIFVGQTEAPLAVKPYLKGLTEPQMFAVMVSGVASIAGTVLAGYALMGAELKYLLAAAFMAAPGGLLMAKIIIPDDAVVSSSQNEMLEMEKEPAQERDSCGSIRHDRWLATGSQYWCDADCVRCIDRDGQWTGGMGRWLVRLRSDTADDSGLDFFPAHVPVERSVGGGAGSRCAIWRETDTQ